MHVNDLELRIVGLSRSGNHAVIEWLLAQTEGPYCFLNCAEPKSNPFDSARELRDGRSYETNVRNFDLTEEAAGNLSSKRLLIYSYEDCFLGAVSHPSFEDRRDEYVGMSARRFNILVLRDPFNLLASRIRSGLFDNRYIWGEKVVTHRMAIRIWKQHAREFLDPAKLRGTTIPILHNRWATDRPYRVSLLERLRLPVRESDATRVAAVAGGSSFDGLHHHGRPERMALEDRWRQFEQDPEYWNLFDAETVALSDRIMGPTRASEQIASKSTDQSSRGTIEEHARAR